MNELPENRTVMRPLDLLEMILKRMGIVKKLRSRNGLVIVCHVAKTWLKDSPSNL